MKDKIITTIISLFSVIIPIGIIILGVINLFGFGHNWILGAISFVGCLISAAGAYGFSVILKAAYVYLWEKEHNQQL